MRLIIISNRLPISARKEGKKISFKRSIGGLSTGMETFLQQWQLDHPQASYLWMGWPGLALSKAQNVEAKTELKKLSCYPIELPKKIADQFYYGFCNKTLWPLFLNFPSYATYKEEQWKIYQKVNQMYFDALKDIIQDGDIIWIHDYHLMLLPELIKQKFNHIQIGFFLHIPFPAQETYQFLPKLWRDKLLHGILGADLIGFHTHEYNQNFLKCVLKNLGYENDMGMITTKERTVRSESFPMGIDYYKVQKLLKTKKIKALCKNIKSKFSATKIMLSIDRLDYSKGIANRLKAYDYFLQNHSEWHEKISLIVIVAPSRDSIAHYSSMKREINEWVGYINGKYGTLYWSPIIYQYHAYSFEELVALYHVSDILLVTPIRDGMNLIAKEFIAALNSRKGMLILSETAGAAKELSESFIINPNSIEEISTAIYQALNLKPEKRLQLNTIMKQRMEHQNILYWGNKFINELNDIGKKQQDFNIQCLSEKSLKKIKNSYQDANQRLILLDYDGTLMPFFDKPEHAIPSKKIMMLLEKLSRQSHNTVAIVSGRERKTLEKWFGAIKNLYLVSEHGAYIKQNSLWKSLVNQLDDIWKKQIIELLDPYVGRLPGAFIEEKECSITLHYRLADPMTSANILYDLHEHLIDVISNTQLQVLSGNKVIEIRPSTIHKGNAAQYFLSLNDYDFIFAAGDDETDEDLFRKLPENSYSIKIGLNPSYANYNLKRYTELVSLLENFVTPGDFQKSIRSILIQSYGAEK